MITLERDEYCPMREDLYGTLERYLNNGIHPGGFMIAVLENNLLEAFARADIENSANLKNIVGYIYHHLPSNAWGSKEKILKYISTLKQAA